ncbi:MAG: tetratricopeptide repeat protein [Coriobacteriales bacterium]|nr:tetratricopeptide repeat protein [Coriobacteriales bacterium]
MKSIYYEQATTAYNAADYPQALKGYYQCLKEDWSTFRPGDAGLVYHRIGNCLIKMRNFREAAVSYQKALQDDGYSEKTSIYVNLGTTLNGIGKYTEAVTYFNKALSDASYATPYRAYMGLGNAYTKLERNIEAGTAYRDAALDESNPNPVKALMSLATTFSTLGRPHDAAEAYLAILDFRVTGKTLNTTLDRLGQAYVAAGRYQEGFNTFEELLSRERFSLSAEGTQDYQKARRALGLAVESTPAASEPVVAATQDDAFAGLDHTAQLSSSQIGPYDAVDLDAEQDFGGGNVPHPGDTGFFTATDADLIASSKRAMRRERKLRHTGLKVFLVIVALLVVLLGVSIVAYTQGVGIPSQEKVITDFFKAYADDEPIDVVKSYWVVGAEEDEKTLARLLDGVAKSSNVTIRGVDAHMRESQVLVDVRLSGSDSAPLHYRIDLVRDLLGWKIGGIELVFASTETTN